MNKTYAGIGSRNTPIDILFLMEDIGKFLARCGYTLFSGHAQGADLAFETGCDRVNGNKKIFIPWAGFNGSDSLYNKVTLKAREIAGKYCRNYAYLPNTTQLLFARNSYQVLGEDLDSPVDFIVCYTPEGKLKGGTSQAIRIAKDFEIPVFNFGNYEDDLEVAKEEFKKFIEPFVKEG